MTPAQVVARYNKLHVAAGSPTGGQFGSSGGGGSAHPAKAAAPAKATAASQHATAAAQHKADHAAAAAQKKADRMKAIKSKLQDSGSRAQARSALGGANLEELQQLAAEYKLSTAGDKPALIDRIVTHKLPSLVAGSRSAVAYAHTKATHYADPGYQADGKKRYALDDAEQCRAAWSYINMPDNAAKYSSEDLAKVKAAIRAAGKKYGIQFADDTAQRWAGTDVFMRSFALQDLAIRSGGDGRTVEAYAAVFNIPAEIRDPQGHYNEVIDPTAFNRTIANNARRVGVFYNHGMNLHGQASDRFSVPIGTAEQITADNKGLLTVTRMAQTELGDEILELIRANAIAGYSFTGRLIRSDPATPPSARGFARGRDGSLTTVRRYELGLAEYGPTPMPAYSQAAIVGMRAALQALSATPYEDPADSYDTPDDSGLVADDPHTHSVRQTSIKERIQAMRSDFLQRHESRA